MDYLSLWNIQEEEYKLASFYPILFENLPERIRSKYPYQKEHLRRSLVLLTNKQRVLLEVILARGTNIYCQEKIDNLNLLISCSNREFGTDFQSVNTVAQAIVTAHNIINTLCLPEPATEKIQAISNPKSLSQFVDSALALFGDNLLAALITGSRVTVNQGVLTFAEDQVDKDIDMRLVFKQIDEHTVNQLKVLQQQFTGSSKVDFVTETPELLARKNHTINHPPAPVHATAFQRTDIFLPKFRIDQENIIVSIAMNYWGFVGRLYSLDKVEAKDLINVIHSHLKVPKFVSGLLGLGQTTSMKLAQAINQEKLATSPIAEIVTALLPIRDALRQEITSSVL